MPPTVLILDFGAQYSQLIARRTRELGVYCEIVPYDVPWSTLSLRRPAALILSGGPESTLAEGAPKMDPEIVKAGVPILGICYGMQLLARDIGAELVQLDHAEYGPATLVVADRETPLFDGVPEESRVWMSHGDSVVALPDGYRALASTARCHVAAIGNPEKKIYGVQFHPEVVHTEHGRTVLDNFLHEIAALGRDWKMESFLDSAVRDIRERVGSDKAICALSGGVDSAVAATLVARAIGEQLTCIFVDHGLLRKNEAQQVVAAFREVLHLNVIAVDARERFLGKLAGVEDPERKRLAIGHEFIAVFDEEAAKIPGVKYLVQGTLYPDVIESKTPQSKAGQKIKSHHNVGGLPDEMNLALIEPLRALFKDEVRVLGAGARLARCNRIAPAVSRSRPGGADHRRRDRGTFGDRSRGRRDRSRRDRLRATRPAPVAVFCRADAGQERRRHGRRTHLRKSRRDPSDHQRGRHDGRLGASAPRALGAHVRADRQ